MAAAGATNTATGLVTATPVRRRRCPTPLNNSNDKLITTLIIFGLRSAVWANGLFLTTNVSLWRECKVRECPLLRRLLGCKRT